MHAFSHGEAEGLDALGLENKYNACLNLTIVMVNGEA
jgi:hypothetical protein